MTIIIRESERGFLFKNGIFQRMIAPGKHKIWSFLGESFIKVISDGRLDFPEMSLPILRKDPEFEKCVALIDVPDDRLAIHYVDGRISGTLRPGTYAFWNIEKKNTFETIDITIPEDAAQLPVSYFMAYIPAVYYTKLDVGEGEVGLLFYNGVYQRTLNAGQYYYWNYHTKVTMHNIDMRIKQLDISGQEILTADKVSLRVNFICTYQVTDPVSIVTRLKDYKTQLHVLVQLILREFTGKYRFDELLRQKESIGGFVLEKLRERESEFFIKFSDAGIKDIILPGEIRDIMNTVLIAEKSAQASVITRREETAATKSLLDTARLMDENTTLYKLKELEYLERICERVGSISVDTGGGILSNLRELIAVR